MKVSIIVSRGVTFRFARKNIESNGVLSYGEGRCFVLCMRIERVTIHFHH